MVEGNFWTRYILIATIDLQVGRLLQERTPATQVLRLRGHENLDVLIFIVYQLFYSFLEEIFKPYPCRDHIFETLESAWIFISSIRRQDI